MFGTILLGVSLGLALSLSSAQAQQPAAQDDPVVATVDGTEVHRSEVEAVARTLPEQYRNIPFQQIYPMLLDRAIDFHLLARAAEDQNIADDPVVQAELERARAGVLRDGFVRQQIEAGSTEEKLRARYAELEASPDFAQEQVHARHILVASEDEGKAVIAELEGGADFVEVAKERSIGPSAASGGDLGFFRRDQMVPEFAEAAFALEPGGFTKEPVKTQFGWHVIEVLDRRTAPPSFEESEARLRQDVAREIITALVSQLREGAEIERFDLQGEPMPPAPAAEAPPASE